MFPTKWNNSLSLSNILVDFVFSSKPGGYVGFGSLPDQVLIQKLTFGLLINIHKQVYETCCLCDGLNFKNVLMRHYILALANTFFNIINIWQFKESLPTNLSINALRHWASFFSNAKLQFWVFGRFIGGQSGRDSSSVLWSSARAVWAR